jgi:phosphoribosylaminoimidazole-succinocarboxamide synthase
MLNEQEIRELVAAHGAAVNEGRPVRQLIEDGELPRLTGCTVLEGKVSDSVFGDSLKSASGKPIRLMFRNNRISTHDVNRGAIPFKDQVLAFNHDHMLRLVKRVLGSSQFDVDGLIPSSTVIPAENLELVKLENVVRLYMAESSTSTSLYQHWLAAKEAGQEVMNYAGHELTVSELEPNGLLPYLMDTPSTKEAVDRTIDAAYLVENGICTEGQYAQIRNSSLMAFGMVSQYLAEEGHGAGGHQDRARHQRGWQDRGRGRGLHHGLVPLLEARRRRRAADPGWQAGLLFQGIRPRHGEGKRPAVLR